MSGERSASSTDEHADAFDHPATSVLLRRLFAESLGTFALVFVDCGGAIMGSLAPDQVTSASRALATGLLITSLIYTMGDVSGAHFNPSVTLAFALRKVFPWKRVPLYLIAQLLGGLLSAMLLRGLFGDLLEKGVTQPEHGVGPGLVFEAVFTLFLVSVILGTATRHRVVGPNAAIASGATVGLCALFARPASGASMNPARSLAPALVSGKLDSIWIYIAGPMIGALAGVVAMSLVHPRKHDEECKAAEGEEKAK